MPSEFKRHFMTRAMRRRRERLAAAVQRQNRDATVPGAASDLPIQELKAFPLREPLSGRRYTVIQVRVQSGLSGFGECGPAAESELSQARARIVGTPATSYELIRQQLSPWPAMEAGVNTALLDLLGQRTRSPIFQVLGGPTRFKVRALARLTGQTEEELGSAFQSALQQGHRAFSIPLPPTRFRNHGQAYVRAVRKRLEHLREIGGEGVDFVLAGAGQLTPGDAASLARELERFHLLWFDEPCPRSNAGALGKITSETVTPLGFGAELAKAGDFQDLLREQALDVLRPDLARNGLSQIRKLSALAETYYVAVAPVHAGGPIGTVAALHLAASLPNFFIQEIPWTAAAADRQMRGRICGGNWESVQDGYLQLPTGPGLGLNVNEAALREFSAA